METIEALIHRRSCHNYSDRPVEAEKLARIIEAGQYAPSGMGRQPVTFVAVALGRRHRPRDRRASLAAQRASHGQQQRPLLWRQDRCGGAG